MSSGKGLCRGPGRFPRGRMPGNVSESRRRRPARKDAAGRRRRASGNQHAGVGRHAGHDRFRGKSSHTGRHDPASATHRHKDAQTSTLPHVTALLSVRGSRRTRARPGHRCRLRQCDDDPPRMCRCGRRSVSVAADSGGERGRRCEVVVQVFEGAGGGGLVARIIAETRLIHRPLDTRPCHACARTGLAVRSSRRA